MSRIEIENIYNNYITEYCMMLSKFKSKPKVAIIQVGDLSESTTYVNNKIKAFETVGIEYELFKFDNDVTQYKITTLLDNLSVDDNYTGIFVQLPLPKQLDFNEIKEHINPLKDIDGLTNTNTIKLYNNDESGILPATPKAVMMLIDELNVDLTGKSVCVINRSDLIGKPLVHMLTQRNATVIWCNSYTQHINRYLSNSDIIVSGVNRANIFNKWDFSLTNPHKKLIIDLTTVFENGKLYGSVNREDYELLCRYDDLTTVGGGKGKRSMGAITILALIDNIIKSYRLQRC